MLRKLRYYGAVCSAAFISVTSFSQLTTGTYTVGTSGTEDFSSLTNPGGLFETINLIGISGNVDIAIATDLPSESGAVPLNQFASGFSIRFIPLTPSLKTITHVGGCANDMIRLNNADLLTFDGRFAFSGTARYLSFESDCSDQSVFLLSGDCENVTIRNCIVSSDNSMISYSFGGAIHVEENQINGSNNLTLCYNLIKDHSGIIDLFDAVQINPPNYSGGTMDGLQIYNNDIMNADGKGFYLIDGPGSINGAEIKNNSFYATGIVSGPGTGWAYAPIQVATGSGHIIRGNYIGGTGPQCSGGKLELDMEPGTQSASLIRMKGDLPNGAINYIDSNIFRNLDIETSNANFLIVSAIRLENGNNHVGTVYGNIIGDTSVTATSVSTASIVMFENFNSTSNRFHGVYNSSTGIALIDNNIVGGILLRENNSSGIQAHVFYNLNGIASFNYNKIGGVPNNFVKECNASFRGIYSTGDNEAASFTGNSIRGIFTGTGFDNNFTGIYVADGLGFPTITNNSITNCFFSGDTRFYGIRTDHPGTIIEENEIEFIDLNSTVSGTQFFGVYCSTVGSNVTIKDNRISSIVLLNTTSLTTSIYGMYSTGISDYTYDANFLEKFVINSTSNSSFIRGIHVNSAINNYLENNVVLLDNSMNSNDIYLYGIYDNSSSGNTVLYHNTVDIRGNATGTRRSACYYSASSSDRNIQNNIFNNRRAGGSGGHYALYFNSTSSNFICQYNLLYAEENPAKLVRFGVNMNFANWMATGNGMSSVNPMTTQELVDFTTGKQTTIAGNDIGNPLWVPVDHIDVGRPIGGGPDMGAFELSSDSLLSPLPVKLVYFEAYCGEESHVLSWQTAAELDNQFFTIEQSFDGMEWQEHGTVSGAGNSQDLRSYRLILPANGTLSYYRLSQTDIDGTEEYLGVRTLFCEESDCDELQFKISQNKISVTDGAVCFAADSDLSLIDLSGRFVFSGKKSDEIDITGLRGIFLVRLSDSHRILTERVFINR